MEIKIKHLKNFLLISACLSFASINYFTYVKADTNVSSNGKSCNKTMDSDCDELTNEEEQLYKTDPLSSDTDDDGYSDGIEVKSGYDPTIPAPGDRVINNDTAADSDKNSQLQTGISQTAAFAQDLQTFIESKGNESISNSDISDFVAQRVASKPNVHITFESLPEIDASQIKVLPQNYNNLSDEERKTKLQQDAFDYYLRIAYLLESNAPVAIESNSDFEAFKEDFISHLTDLANASSDYTYFSELGNRLELFLSQVNAVEVPASMVEMHVKALRIMHGFLTLRDMEVNPGDPMAKMELLTKIQDLSDMVADFFGNDFQKYNDTLK